MPVQDSPSSTPILDLEKPLPRARGFSDLRWWQAFLIGFMITVFLPIAATIATEHSPGFGHSIERVGREMQALFDTFGSNGEVWAFCVFGLSLAGALALHELGHALAGTLVGFPTTTLAVGPCVVSHLNGRWHFHFQKFSGLHGRAVVDIPNLRRLRSRLARFSAAGLLTNLLSGSIILLFLVFGGFDHLPRVLRSTAILFAIASFWLFAENAFPRRSRQIGLTDGARLLMLASSQRRTRRWFSLIALRNQAKSGVGPKFWKRTWIKAANYGDDQSVDALSGAWIKYQSIIGGNNLEESAKSLEFCLTGYSTIGKSFQQILIAEASIFQAWYRRNPRKADTWFLKLPKSAVIPPLALIRAKVALDCVCQRPGEMAAYWNEGMRLIQALPEPARTASENSWRAWKVEIDKRFEANPPPSA
jgi:hypothetical protein